MFSLTLQGIGTVAWVPGEPLAIPATGCSGPTVGQELQEFLDADLGETPCLTHGEARSFLGHLS